MTAQTLRQARAGLVDLPFAPPPDVVLDVPVPPSVNVTRRIDHAGKRLVGAWRLQADRHLMQKQYRLARTALGGKPAEYFELHITLDEAQCRADPDNILKCAIDYLKSRELIVDDNLKRVRRLVIEPGVAPVGCRIILKPIEGAAA